MLALLLALAPLQVPDELVFGWEQPLDPTVTTFPTLLELAAKSQTLVLATRTSDDAQIDLKRLGADGVTLWTRAISLADGARFMDLALTDGGGRVVLLLADGGSGAFGQRVLTFDAADGADGWSREFPALPGVAAHDGRLDAAGGVVAVVRSAGVVASPGGNDWTGLLHVLDAAGGSDVAVGATFLGDERPEVSLAPSGSAALLWEVDGTMRVLETASGAVRWEADVPTSSTPLALGSGLTAAIFDASESVVVRTDGVRTVSFDAADGSFLWNYDYVDARDVVRVGPDRVFVCGVEGFGTLQGATERCAMLDAATGAELWSRQVLDPAQASSALFLKRNHAAWDAGGDRVAFRDKSLFVFDAGTGVPLASSEFLGSSGLRNHLAVLPDGSWVGSNDLLRFFGGVVAESFDTDANFQWGEVQTGSEQADAVLLSIDGRDADQTLRTVWQVNPLAEPPHYEVRSAESGEVLSAWPLPFPSFVDAAWATSPDGERVASVEERSNDVAVRVQDATVGDLVWEEASDGSLAGGAELELVWSPDSGRVATIWGPPQFPVSPSFLVRVFDADAPVGWSRAIQPGAGEGPEVDSPRLAWEPGASALLVAFAIRIGADWALRIDRLDAADGATLGSLVWDDATSTSGPSHTALSIDFDATGAEAFVSLLSDTGSEEYVQMLRVDLATMTAVDERLVVPPSITVTYSARGVAASPGATTLALVGRGPLPPPGGGLSPVRLDVLDLPSLDLRYTLEWQNGSPIPFGEVEYANDHVIVVRHGGSPFSFDPSSTLEFFDVATGQSLAAVDDADGLLLTGTLEAGFTLVEGGVAIFGRSDPNEEDAVVQRLDVAPLLSGPDAVASASGGPVEFTLDAGPEHAGDVWLLVGSITGTEPGTPVGEVVVPLVGDLYTRFTVGLGGEGVWTETLGTLDADGAAQGTLEVPPFPPALAGYAFFHAAIVFTAEGGVDFVTQPVAFDFVE